MSSRAEARKDYDQLTRTSLLEADVDSIINEVNGMKNWLKGLTLALIGAAVTLAINVIVIGIS